MRRRSSGEMAVVVGSRLRPLGLLAVVSSDTTYENGEVTVLSRGECESISDLVLGGDGGRTCTKMVKSSWSWLLDKMFYNGWVTPFQSLVGLKCFPTTLQCISHFICTMLGSGDTTVPAFSIGIKVRSRSLPRYTRNCYAVGWGTTCGTGGRGLRISRVQRCWKLNV